MYRRSDDRVRMTEQGCGVLAHEVDVANDQSVIEWIDNIGRGDGDGANQLWEAYSERVVKLATRVIRQAHGGELMEFTQGFRVRGMAFVAAFLLAWLVVELVMRAPR